MDEAAAPSNGQHVQQPILPDAPRRKSWRPLKILSRFRARVGARTQREESLPLQLDLAQSSRTSITTAPAESTSPSYACDVVYICQDATPADLLIRQRIASSESLAERNALAEVHQ